MVNHHNHLVSNAATEGMVKKASLFKTAFTLLYHHYLFTSALSVLLLIPPLSSLSIYICFVCLVTHSTFILLTNFNAKNILCDSVLTDERGCVIVVSCSRAVCNMYTDTVKPCSYLPAFCLSRISCTFWTALNKCP